MKDVFRSLLTVSFVVISVFLGLITKADEQANRQRNEEFLPRAFAIINAKLIPAPGQEIANGKLVMRDGLIVALGVDIPVPPDAEVIDAQGLIVYPGFIDAGTTALLREDQPATPAPAAPVDFSKYALANTRPDLRKSLTPEYQAAEHLNLNPEQLEKRRQSGFTSLHVIPSGRLASGTGALVSTRGGVLRETLLQPQTAASLRVFNPGDRGGGYPSTLMGGTAHLRQAFLDAAHHAQQRELFSQGLAGISRPEQDATWEALQNIRDKKIPAWFFAQTRDEIVRGLNFSHEFELPLTLWGGHEAAREVDNLSAKKVACVLTLDLGHEPKIEPPSTDSKLVAEVKDPLPVQEERLTRWQDKVKTASLLQQKGIKLAFSSLGLHEPHEVLAGIRKVITAGLPRDAALAGLTSDAAEILGQQNRLGTLAPGKLAHVIVLNGPFDDERTKVRHVFVDGKRFEYHKDAGPVPPSAAAPAQLAGTWNLDIEGADGKTTAQLRFTQDKDQLRGHFESPQGDGKVTSGSVSEQQAEWTVSIGVGDRTLEIKFTTTSLTPEKLEGTLKAPFGAATKWTAKKEPLPTAPKNAVELSLEADPQKAPAGLPVELHADRLRRPPPTGGNVFIQGGLVLTGKDEPPQDVSILVKAGKIAALGKDLKPEPDMRVIDATGLVIMPGIIDTHSHIMIGKGLMDVNEYTQSIVPEVRVKDAVATEDVAAYRALAGGTTVARLLHGSANVIGGQDAVVKLKFGERVDRQIVADAHQGVKFALGENVKFQENRFPNTRMGVEATLNRAFLEALDYRRVWLEYQQKIAADPNLAGKLLPPRRDLRLEALMDIVNQQKFIHSHCYRADENLMLLRVASGLGIRVWSLQHVLEGYKVAPEIAAHGASCSTFSDWWAYKVEAFDATPYNAALLQQAGANVVIKSDDWELIRHLYLEAAKPVRYGGMTLEQALRTVTLNPARELGLQERMGSIEVGKEANLAIFNGHPLHAFSRCEYTLIDGEVYFQRSAQPTAMSEAAAARKQSVITPMLPAPDFRGKILDFTPHPQGRYALVGGILHPVDGPEILGGTLLIAEGRITAIGKEVAIPAETKIIDISGLHIYPGMIDAGTTLGLLEIDKVRETHDYAEAGLFQPDLRAGVAINPDSELIPVARAGGITTALIAPTGGVISGQASVSQLGGWTVPDMVLDLEAGLVLRWSPWVPEHMHEAHVDVKERQEFYKNRNERLDKLRDFIHDAKTYLKLRADSQAANQPGPVPDPRFEALKPYLAGERPVFIEANHRREIVEALLFAEEHKLKMILTGAADAWKVAAELKARNVPVIIGPVMRKPAIDYDPFDAPYANPGRLFEAGVLFCIRSDEASNSRNAPFEAAMAVAYGLPAEEALKAVTVNPAKILGLDSKLGSLTPGKLANLVITDGSPLLQLTQVKGTFVGGQPYPLDNRQTRFYEKYRQRLKK